MQSRPTPWEKHPLHEPPEYQMLTWILGAVVFAVVLTTLLPLTNSVVWWVRMWDFPRLHIAIVALVTLVICAWIALPFKLLIIAALGSALLYQAAQIFPYTPLARTEIDLLAAPHVEDKISMMSVNVLMENTRHDDLSAIIDREDPDILFLMETDTVWNEALSAALARYPTIKSHIADDHYGLIFATRLETKRVELLWPTADDTPAIRAVLQSPNGVAFNFIGLHPRPPVPGNDTAVRDKQIKDAALMTQSSERPTVIMGDFNDVAWSWTTKRLKNYGNLVEPRVGRGLISSFHASYPFMRLPIDQLFVTKDVGLVSFNRLENFGSDHFPMVSTVFFNASGRAAYGQ